MSKNLELHTVDSSGALGETAASQVVQGVGLPEGQPSCVLPAAGRPGPEFPALPESLGAVPAGPTGAAHALLGTGSAISFIYLKNIFFNFIINPFTALRPSADVPGKALPQCL